MAKETMKQWIDNKFVSSTVKTEEFKSFAKDFKKYIKQNLPIDAKLVNFSVGHFDISGFIERGGKFVYFSTSDVRSFNNEWYHDLLIRTAKHEKDFTGGSNEWTDLPNFQSKVDNLLKRSW